MNANILKISSTLIFATALSACGGSGDSSKPPVTATPSPTSTATPTASPTATPTPNPTSTAAPTASPSPSSTPIATPTLSPSPIPNTLKTTALDCGAVTGNVVNMRLNDDAKAYVLCKHNQIRSEVALGLSLGDGGTLPMATDMRRLSWDPKLEQVAQDWANLCQWGHNANRTNEYNQLNPSDIHGDTPSSDIHVGENLAAAFDSRATEMDLVMVGFNGLESEGADWTFGTINGTEACSGDQCGHFTQLVWAQTYRVGCAVNVCDAGTIFSSNPSTYLVCDYASGGNYTSQAPYKTGNTEEDVCSEATSGQTVCKNGLTEAADYQTGL